MNLPFDIIYKDANYLVINKPAGMPVHKGLGKKMTTLDDFLCDLRFGLPEKPQLAHRLDKDTSGCLVFGRHRQALAKLAKLFAGNHIKKTYLAIVHGQFKKTSGLIDLPIAKQQKNNSRLWWGRVDRKHGKPAQTGYQVLKSSDKHSFVELTPITGRTHQLRIHMQAIGHPILGDNIYGLKGNEEGSMCLHASSILVNYYTNKNNKLLQAPLPPHMEKLLVLFP